MWREFASFCVDLLEVVNAGKTPNGNDLQNLVNEDWAFECDPRNITQCFDDLPLEKTTPSSQSGKIRQTPILRSALWKTFANLWKTATKAVESLWKACGERGEKFGKR